MSKVMPSIRFQPSSSYFAQVPRNSWFCGGWVRGINQLSHNAFLVMPLCCLFLFFIKNSNIQLHVPFHNQRQCWECTESSSAVSDFPVFVCSSAHVLILHKMQDNRPALPILSVSNIKLSCCLAKKILDHIPMVSHRSPDNLSRPSSRGSM